MRSEDIEAVIITKDELELGGKIANGSGGNTKGNRGRWVDESGGRGNGNKTADGTGAEADDRPLLLEAVILKDKEPCFSNLVSK